MAKKARVTLEIGPKGKKVVAVAPDWPGLERGAKTQEGAIEKLRSYIPRYSQVTKLAKMDMEFDAIKNVHVVEEYSGTGSTDFWVSRSRFRVSTNKKCRATNWNVS